MKKAFSVRLPHGWAGRKLGKPDAIAAVLREEIARGKLPAGTRLPPHPVLARRFGVSVVTVQMSLSVLAREGFVVAQPRRGTFVATQLPHLTNYALVFWNDPLVAWDWSRYYIAMTGAALAIEREGHCKLSLFHGIDQHADSEDRQRLLSLMQSGRLAGMIFVNTPMFLVGSPLLEEPGIPRVAMMSEQLYPHVPVVAWTGFLERALDYLAARGRKRIAIVGIGTYPEWDRTLDQMLAARGLSVPAYWRQAVSLRQPGAAASCVELLMRAPAGERPDGLFITDDNLVEDGLAGLVAAGVRVPQDVEVVTHCNFPWPSRSVLPVKRLGIDTRQVLRKCLDLIDRQRRGEAVPGYTPVAAVFEEELGRTRETPATASRAEPVASAEGR